MKNTIATGNWTIAGPEGILENPHASMTSFEATKQALNLLCYTHYLFPLSLPFSYIYIYI